jgi:hypothetical protein
MVAPENPSAGKFGPPPENAERERARARGSDSSNKTLNALAPVALVLGITALKIFGHSRRGWMGAAASILIGAGYVVEHIVRRRRRESQGDGGDTPYSPPTNITR